MVAPAPVAPSPSVGPVTAAAEPLAAALHRLAAKGQEEGCAVLPGPLADIGVVRVSSSRAGEVPYVVSLLPGRFHGCDCPGYARHQYCKHYALALVHMGWLPEPPDDDPPSPAAPALAVLPPVARRTLAAADLARRYPEEQAAA